MKPRKTKRSLRRCKKCDDFMLIGYRVRKQKKRGEFIYQFYFCSSCEAKQKKTNYLRKTERYQDKINMLTALSVKE